MSELKSCPFCGQEATIYRGVVYNCCGYSTDNESYVLPAVWQQRPIEDGLRQQIEDAHIELDKFFDNRNIGMCTGDSSLQFRLAEIVSEITSLRQQWQEEHTARIRAEENLKLAQAEITELRNRGWGNDPVIAELRAMVEGLEAQLKTARKNFVWLGKELDDD